MLSLCVCTHDPYYIVQYSSSTRYHLHLCICITCTYICLSTTITDNNYFDISFNVSKCDTFSISLVCCENFSFNF